MKSPSTVLSVVGWVKEAKIIQGSLMGREGLINVSAGNEWDTRRRNKWKPLIQRHVSFCGIAGWGERRDRKGGRDGQMAGHALFINTKTYFLLGNGSCYSDQHIYCPPPPPFVNGWLLGGCVADPLPRWDTHIFLSHWCLSAYCMNDSSHVTHS